jgi:hypothetical protein
MHSAQPTMQQLLCCTLHSQHTVEGLPTPSWFCRPASSPRPRYSTRYRAVALSTMMMAKRDSDSMLAAAASKSACCSVLCARAYATLSSTSSGFIPYLLSGNNSQLTNSCKCGDGSTSLLDLRRHTSLLSAVAAQAGRCPLCRCTSPCPPRRPWRWVAAAHDEYVKLECSKVNACITVPEQTSRQPCQLLQVWHTVIEQLLTWQVTASVWHICVFPVRNSPYISVMAPLSMPPGKFRTHNDAR